MLTLLDISQVCTVIQSVNSCNLLTDKKAEKVPRKILRPEKKNEKTIGELEMSSP